MCVQNQHTKSPTRESSNCRVKKRGDGESRRRERLGGKRVRMPVTGKEEM